MPSCCAASAAPAAATYLAGWICGTLAGAVGHALATTDSGFVGDRAVRWHQHPDGWIDRVELGTAHAVVPPGHPWADQPDVRTIDADRVASEAVAALIELLEPVIDVLGKLGPTGRIGLWNEVADGLALSVTYQRDIPVRPDITSTLLMAVEGEKRPWKAQPTPRIVDTPTGPVYLGQKGGCCLAYTCPAETHEHSHDDDHRAYYALFPNQPGEPRYCTTCKFRDPVDSEQRQRFWIERSASNS